MEQFAKSRTGNYWAWSLNKLTNDPVTPTVVNGYYIDEKLWVLVQRVASPELVISSRMVVTELD